ncbi:kinase-like domain-containing protein [Penicillium malachiteum]|uniref:kinase-like domain-containing protein n=1 Tax=Penicillium malachiteum TaxID=1324776 RepID=UPI0025496B90|nr:kinase-like domain-containing protein [Penicillium malachiteum]KAJ5728600.1 kinase-like domain-containing protein [Penicillium malachiteum]
MHPENTLITHTDLSKIKILRDISHSEASSIFEVELDGQIYALKLLHNDGDPGYTEKGRDLKPISLRIERIREALCLWRLRAGHCSKILRLHQRSGSGCFSFCFHLAFHHVVQHFARDKLKPSAILLEYLPNAECLNCVNYSDALYAHAPEGLKEIHSAGVHHRDIYPRNMLLVHGNTDRLVWIDFDVATTFTDPGTEQKARSDYEIALVKGLGDALARAPSLPMNVSNMLTHKYREKTRLKDSPQTQNFIKGFEGS